VVKENRTNSSFHDIKIEEDVFRISWNLDSSTTLAIDENSVYEAGGIHTCQGLEFEYVGVIIDDDLRYEDGEVITDYTKRAKTDQSLKGIKKMLKESPEEALEIADKIFRNTYRTLMTRGQKGCYIFCTDKKLEEYFRARWMRESVYSEKAYGNIKIAEDKGSY
jgi:uncharacterized protein